MQDRRNAQTTIESPLAQVNVEKSAQWTPQTRRVGVIARKIGNYPLWSKEGKKMHTTLLQVLLWLNYSFHYQYHSIIKSLSLYLYYCRLSITMLSSTCLQKNSNP